MYEKDHLQNCKNHQVDLEIDKTSFFFSDKNCQISLIFSLKEYYYLYRYL